MRYNNYHKHDHYGNPWISDVVVKPEDYIKRAQELGHTTVFTTNHGVTGSIFDWLTQTKDTDLKLVYGMEAYFVRSYDADEDGKRDRSNKHLIIIAMNNDGVMQLNDIMSTAHGDGFYYRARVDADRLFSLNPRDFVITSACVAGIWDDPELLLACKRHFGDNFFLELQPHNIDLQKTVNQQMLEFSRSSGIPIIHANDSHYIYPGDKNYREIYLRGHDMFYKDDNAVESDMILDYPDDETILERYERQGILTRSEAELALHNTLVFDNCEKITLINDDIKLPQISKTPNEDLKKIINDRWLVERESIPKEEWPKYLEAIREEVKVVEDTHMANYFLIDYNVAKSAQEEFGGRLTNTGRGSAPSFYITKMLGLTDIDRVDAPITLFPSRFMSVERILGSRSLPDIDLNTADRVPFIKATKKLLGEENCEWMLSWKPLQAASAFRLYCKGIGKEISEYDSVAKDLDSYREDPKWRDLIIDSEKFIGVIDSVSESPCSMLLYDKPVRKEIGLVRTSKGVLCCLLDGYNCDKYKYLKNDYLQVQVWAIIKDTCKLADIPIPTIRELDNLLDEKTYEIYDKGLTCSINQADSEFATPLAMRFKPRSVSDMSAFVAILRPGCASLLQDFIDRKPYTTGVQELDGILTEGSHRMIYQELIMKYLIWLGIPETRSYDIIKKIAKKKFKEAELAELKEKLLAGWVNRVGKEEGFRETWDVVEDAARYSFNACVSGDTIIQRVGANGHWQPTVKEMFLIKNDEKYARETGHYELFKKYRSNGYGNALSMYNDGRIKKNSIVDIKYSGKAPIFRVLVDTGEYIDCTLNHKFPTPNGIVDLFNLSCGDVLYTKDKYEINRDKYNFTNGNYTKNIPKLGERGFQKNPNGNTVLFLSQYKRCVDSNMPCSMCGKKYSKDLRFELHHKDFNRTNNCNENLEWLCCSCHKKMHYANGRKKAFDKGIPVKESIIKSISFLRVDDVYDIEMNEPAHNFISESGLVTSNSHSLSYAYDSLYGAYLKSHYPLEYYTVALNYYSGDETRTMKLTQELSYFGIKLKPIKFRLSQAGYSLSREDNSIYKGIGSIKHMSAQAAQDLYELRDKKYNSFIELLADIKNCSVDSRQLKILINLNFFEEFGEPNYLLNASEIFYNFPDKQISKERLEEFHVNDDDVRPLCLKETAKMFSQYNKIDLITEIVKHAPYHKRTLKEDLDAQNEYLGYFTVSGEQYRGIGYVKEVDTKYSPKLKVYGLKRGEMFDCKIDKKTFNKNKLNKGDLIRITGQITKPKSRLIDGKWEPIPDTSDLWITKYQVVNM